MRKLILVAACLWATTSFADTREERLEIARDYVAATMADMDMDAFVAQMYEPVLDQIESQSDIEFSDAQRAEVNALYQREMLPALTEILRAQDEIMADIFTLEEITALRDFYQTDVGRSVMTKLPRLIALQQPQIMQLMQSKMPVLMNEMMAILTE
ncbi:DUF2059 domain-containing protein [Palleronia caenipelagi]|uniref:DUF2059 domain-containing protein n=1 Tax=Palleronia caenipelagi TaxID=2489174 RepID=A0A547Q9Q9_9RHOB|nr:DUF2059 domain-containing protein [Palleronia caenipelagi]TRD23081.1 DUF2059 domain-containing protein [Palleronia caenipelagi]